MLGLGRDYLVDWQVYRHLLADRELMAELAAVTARVSELCALAGGIVDPPLRVLDVALWITAPAELRRRGGRGN